MDMVLNTLKPFKRKIKGVVVESTYNWYWLVDGLMGKKYKVHLANPLPDAAVFRDEIHG